MKTMTATIELEGMQFTAYHGCLPSEREEGNLFEVDFKCRYDIGDAAVSDDLEDTLDYGEIYDIVAAQMAVPSRLLEHVAARIADAIASAHPEIVSFSIRVAKRNPPVKGPAQWSSVTLEWPYDSPFTIIPEQ